MTTPSLQLRMDLEEMESELIPESTQASDDGARLHLCDQPITPIAQAMLGSTAVEFIPISATVSNDGACNNECVMYYEGTTDAAQPVPPGVGMDRDPSRIIYCATLAGACGRRYFESVTYAAPRDSVEQGVHLSQEEDAAKPVVSVANFITKICTGLLETDGDSHQRRVVADRPKTSDTVFSDLVYLNLSCGRIQTKRMLDTSRSRRSWRVYIATRSSSAGNFAVTQPTNDVQQGSLMISLGRSRQRSR